MKFPKKDFSRIVRIRVLTKNKPTDTIADAYAKPAIGEFRSVGTSKVREVVMKCLVDWILALASDSREGNQVMLN
jgi:hypothetical protein